ncbi:hypothetical protein BLS_002172 [Venturia inaequalis]|uniref:Fatty acid desaturase domain-containing protein n=1 Tax=Venturia inaequalis TaxID=5025 RepID=A0A8H3U8A4_VENIN|nr:hypothetical protein BLS_002172 [Venturia inaequalis]KAE9964978.1 hypothetical protein EG328_010056 [Venturia inaequalis]RDI77204.1 hypothetical protein Vi05172_g12785 [Venturia inaequalis]
MTTVTIPQLREAIPKHCFERSATKSIAYLVRDLALIATLAWSAFTFIPTIQSDPARLILWQIYGFVQGLVGTGLWIIAHECGHGAFSPNQTLNDWCGLFGHSLLLVPYHSWRITHHRHHNYVAHMDKDTAFVPKRAEELSPQKSTQGGRVHAFLESIEDAPAVVLAQLVLHQFFGWPLHMMFNASAGRKSAPEGVKLGYLNSSHFLPLGGLFTRAQWKKIMITNIGLLCVLSMLYKFGQAFGPAMVMHMYFVPWFWVHHWLVAITYLHHNHVDVPHFEDETWTFVKGASSTVDRDFGFVGEHLFHNIIETHVAHHFFPKIPFYHAREATKAIRPVLGESYNKDTTNMMVALWSTFRNCRAMEQVLSKDGKGMVRMWVK